MLRNGEFQDTAFHVISLESGKDDEVLPYFHNLVDCQNFNKAPPE
jgi:hypothetical protein